MDKKTINQLKKVLEQKKKRIEKELSSIAKKDPKLKDDYDVRFPHFGLTQSPDEEALEVSTYESRLPIEYALELRLQDISLALDKIKRGKFGLCEKCKKSIEGKRLKAIPEVRICLKCAQKK